MIKNNKNMVNIPEGKKVVVDGMIIRDFNNKVAFEYNIYLAKEFHPLHVLQEEPIRDYSDYIDDKPFFKTQEEMELSLSKENILNFIRENHVELLSYIENKGLMLCSEWIDYNDLL